MGDHIGNRSLTNSSMPPISRQHAILGQSRRASVRFRRLLERKLGQLTLPLTGVREARSGRGANTAN